MKLIGGFMLALGIVLIAIGIWSEKEISFNDVNKTNVRIDWIAYGTLISFIGIFITFYKEFNERE